MLVRVVSALVRTLLVTVVRLAVVIAVVLGLLYLRLSQGPLHLAFVGQMLTGMFNENATRVEVELGDLVLSLGGAGEPAGLQFVDVRVTNPEGVTLFAVPRLTASFETADLLSGRPWPTRVALIRPEARLVLTEDGHFRFGIGGQAAPAGAKDEAEEADAAAQFAAIERLIDGFVGDIEPVPEASRLARVDILGADLTYVNEAAKREWRTRRANLLVYRVEGGARAALDIGLAAGAEPGVTLAVTAERRRGTGATRLSGRFERLQPEHLAEQLEELEWLRLFDAPLSGSLAGTIYADGRVEGLAGSLAIGKGRILALGSEGEPIERADLDFEFEPGLRRMRVTRLDVVSTALDARLSGFIDLSEDAAGEVTGLAGQLEIAGIRAEIPEAFSDPLQFDGGQIVARMDFGARRIEVAQAHLRREDLVLDVTGRAQLEHGIWRTDLRAGGRNLTVEDLLQHWPLVAAPGAREWVAKNIRRARLDGVVAHMHFEGDEPQLALDFTYSGLESTYLKDMTPIRDARGRGALTLTTFNLQMDEGVVEPVEGMPVRLDGSEVRMLALNVHPYPAEITLRAVGPTRSILSLIDEQPLGFTSKLGLDPAAIAGHSEVVAEIRLPLIQALLLDDVGVQAKSVLHDLRLPFQLPNGQVVDVAAQSVVLEAGKEEMHFVGDTTVDGQPMNIDWHEYYGRGRNHRSMVFKGTATPPLLARFEISDENFRNGEAPMVLSLVQTGTPDYAFELNADMGPGVLVIPELGWTKPVGQRGRLVAKGTFGEMVRIDSFNLDTDELKATGAAELGDEGYIRKARIDRMQFRGLADVAARVTRGTDDTFRVLLTGNRVDLALLDELPAAEVAGPGASAGTGVIPIEMDFNIDEMQITPRVVARPATGLYRRDAGNTRTARLEGQVEGRVPFAADFRREAGQPGEIEVTSEQAGELLSAAQLFSGAQGGRLRLKAVLAPDAETEMAGVARIKDVTVRGTGTFTTILDEGGVTEAAAAAKEEGGLFFDTVRLPFTYGGGVMTLDDTTAKSSLVAVKVAGTVDENKGEVDLVGVISPVYALTGIFDNIPLLGQILSGGKGEGILAMTFTVAGPMDEPRFSVNPLSLLAPGFLRKIFSGRSKRVDEEFIEKIQREID